MNECITQVDPSGNLSLLVGSDDNQRTSVVSPAARCLANPVWRAWWILKATFSKHILKNVKSLSEMVILSTSYFFLNISSFATP